jgi:hypothetical protein
MLPLSRENRTDQAVLSHQRRTLRRIKFKKRKRRMDYLLKTCVSGHCRKDHPEYLSG